MFGGFFVPTEADAGLLSSLFGSEAHADAIDTISKYKDVSPNSQTMALLEANIFAVPVASVKTSAKAKDAPKEDTKGDESKDSPVDANANVNISKNALLPATGPMNVATGGPEIDDDAPVVDDQPSVYVVRKADSISQIADMFGVSVNTILWANDMKKGDKLVEGDVLFILPINGLEHTVTSGQTLQGIANLYKADINEILDYNDITKDAKLAVGDKLMIPNAEKSEESAKPVKNLGASIAKDNQYYAAHPVQTLSGYFINPVPGARKSQGIHDKNGVDLAIAKGTPIRAAAAGTILLARNGYNGGFGNLVIISHSNGTQTLYAHQSSIAVSTGMKVTQGQTIGYVGSTGRSTGAHLHFEVHGARNPGADGSWAQ